MMIMRYNIVLIIYMGIAMNLSCQNTNSWSGMYSVSQDGIATGAHVAISAIGKDIKIVINQELTYWAVEDDLGLSGTDELGGTFSIRLVEGYKVFKIGGMEFILNSLDKSKIEKDTLISNDEFEGIYKLIVFGVESEKSITIKKIGYNSYNLQLDLEEMRGNRDGRKLHATNSSGESLDIIFENGTYSMETMGMQFEMIRIGDIDIREPRKETIFKNGVNTLNPDIIGTWVKSSSYVSGSGDMSFSISTVVTYQFKRDGRYSFSSRVIGGTNDVGGDSGNKYHEGTYYTMVELGQKLIVIDGDQKNYKILNGGSQLMLGDLKNIYSKN